MGNKSSKSKNIEKNSNSKNKTNVNVKNNSSSSISSSSSSSKSFKKNENNKSKKKHSNKNKNKKVSKEKNNLNERNLNERNEKIIVKKSFSSTNSSSLKQKRIQKIEKWFSKLIILDQEDDPNDIEDEDFIGPNGIYKLCNDLEIDAESDIIILLIAEKCKAKRMAYFSKEEFIRGMLELEVENVSGLMKKIPNMREEFKLNGPSREFMKFIFNFAKESEEIKTLDLEFASELIKMILINTVHGKAISTFVKNQTDYRGINQDQWLGIWEFCKNVDKDFNGYEDDGAWPLIIDLFVENEREEE